MFCSEQNKPTNRVHFLLCVLLGSILLLGNSSCGSSLNQQNYRECIPKLEEDRQKVRIGNGYSYKAPSYEECRAPVRYRLDAD